MLVPCQKNTVHNPNGVLSCLAPPHTPPSQTKAPVLPGLWGASADFYRTASANILAVLSDFPTIAATERRHTNTPIRQAGGAAARLITFPAQHAAPLQGEIRRQQPTRT